MNIFGHLTLFAAAVAAIFCTHAEPLKIGFYVGRGGRSNGGVTWARILSRAPEAEVVFLEGEDVRGGKLNGLDLLVMPGGDSSLQAKSLGEAGREAIRAYLRAGGAYFGTCAGCSIVQDKPGYLKLIPYRKTKTPHRGSGMIGTDFSEEGAKVLGVKPGVRPMTYHSGPLLEPTSPEAVPDCHDLKILAIYAGSILESSKDPEPFPMQGRPAALSAGYGQGRLVVTSFHPEHYPLTRDVIVGAVRALTGRTLTLTTPVRARGALRLGVYTPVVMGRRSYLPILALDRLPGVALQLVDGEFIDRGELDGLDALVVPDGDVQLLGDRKVLKGFRAAAADAFVARGGHMLSWGKMAARCPEGTRVCADGDAVVAAVRGLSANEPPPVRSVRLDNVAHRGLWVEAGLPQNTVEAIRAAYEAGARIVETDFVETESGEMICLHDIKALASMSSIVIEPKKITPEDRARINLGEKAGLPRPYRIPLLSEVLAVVPKDAVLQAEIKVYGSGYARTFDAAVKAAGLSETNIIVSSFQEKALADFHRQCPSYRTLWLGCDIKKPGFDLDAVLTTARTDGFDILCPGCEAAQKAGFTRQDADRIRAAGFGFRFYGVNAPEALRYAADMGAAGFTCNTFLKAYEWADELPDVELAP